MKRAIIVLLRIASVLCVILLFNQVKMYSRESARAGSLELRCRSSDAQHARIRTVSIAHTVLGVDIFNSEQTTETKLWGIAAYCCKGQCYKSLLLLQVTYTFLFTIYEAD